MNIKDFFLNFKNNFIRSNDGSDEIRKLAIGISESLRLDGINAWTESNSGLFSKNKNDNMVIVHGNSSISISINFYKYYPDSCLNGCEFIHEIEVLNDDQAISLSYAERSLIASQIEKVQFPTLIENASVKNRKFNSIKYFESYAENRSNQTVSK